MRIPIELKFENIFMTLSLNYIEQKTAYPYSTNCTIIWSAIISVSVHVKFSFSENAIKFFAIFLVVLTLPSSKHEDYNADCATFCGLLRKAEL